MNKRLPGLGAPIFQTAKPHFLNAAALIPPRAPDHFFSAGQIIHTLNAGDALPVYMRVGDDNEETEVLSSVVCDFNRCGNLFDVASRMAANFENEKEHVKAQIAPNIDERLVARLTGIFLTMETIMNTKMSMRQRQKQRENIYKRAPLVALSQIARSGMLECVEKSAFAKYWMGQHGFNMFMVNHAFRFDSKPSEGMMHAMLGITQRDCVVLFDPNNAMLIDGTLSPSMGTIKGQFYVPSLYQVPRERWDRLLAQGKTGPAMIDIHTDSVWRHAAAPEKAWFGFGLPDQTRTPENWLVPAKPADSGAPAPKGP